MIRVIFYYFHWDPAGFIEGSKLSLGFSENWKIPSPFLMFQGDFIVDGAVVIET